MTTPGPRRLRSVCRAARTFPRRSPTAASRRSCGRKNRGVTAPAGGGRSLASQVRRLRVAPEVDQGCAHVPDLHGKSRARPQKHHLRVRWTSCGEVNHGSGSWSGVRFMFLFQEMSPEPSAAAGTLLHASTSSRKFGTSEASFTKSSGLQTGTASLIRAKTG